MIPLASMGFGWPDWLVVAGYMALLLASGVWLARREPAGTDEYFVASRRMPVWAVALSVLASALSVATFLGVPELSYKGDLTYLSTNIGGLIAVAVVAGFFIPAFYKRNVTSIYELLEQRFGPGAKYAASGAFMVGRVFASGVRVYIAAIPLAMLLFGQEGADQAGPLIGAILALTLAGVLYTLVGGIASVIWTDVLQTMVLFGSVIAGIVVLLYRIPAPLGEVMHALSTAGPDGGSKLTVLKIGLDLSKPWLGLDLAAEFTLLTAVFGISLQNMAAYGADHDMVQRMLTCKSAVKGSRSVIVAILIGIPVVALFLCVGLLLFVFYKRPDLMGGAMPATQPAASEQVFMVFILNELPMGLRGLMVAGLFAVGLGSLNSAINAMGTTLIKDFYMRLVPRRSEGHYLSASRWAVAGWGAVLAGFAVLCIYWKKDNPDTGLITFALQVMSFAYSGLLAVFLCALFTRRGSSASAIASLVTGFTAVLLMQKAVWAKWAGAITWTEQAAGATVARSLADVKLAFPWQMLIATSLAFGVCCLGSQSGRRGQGAGD